MAWTPFRVKKRLTMAGSFGSFMYSLEQNKMNQQVNIDLNQTTNSQKSNDKVNGTKNFKISEANNQSQQYDAAMEPSNTEGDSGDSNIFPSKKLDGRRLSAGTLRRAYASKSDCEVNEYEVIKEHGLPKKCNSSYLLSVVPCQVEKQKSKTVSSQTSKDADLTLENNKDTFRCVRSQSGQERKIAYSNRSSGYGTGSQGDNFDEEQNNIIEGLVKKSLQMSGSPNSNDVSSPLLKYFEYADIKFNSAFMNNFHVTKSFRKQQLDQEIKDLGIRREMPESPDSLSDEHVHSHEDILEKMRCLEKYSRREYLLMHIERGEPPDRILHLQEMMDPDICTNYEHLSFQISQSSGSSTCGGIVKHSTGFSPPYKNSVMHKEAVQLTDTVFTSVTQTCVLGNQSKFSFDFEDGCKQTGVCSIEYESNSERFLEQSNSQLLDQLRMANCCRQDNCKKMFCIKGQDLLNFLENHLNHGDIINNNVCMQLLHLIQQHAEICDEMACPTPFCWFFHEKSMPLMEQISALKRVHSIATGIMGDWQSHKHKYSKLSTTASSLTDSCPPRENKEWDSISWLGSPGRTLYVMSSIPDVPLFWVIKKLVRKDSHDATYLTARYLWKLLLSVSQIQHPNITCHLWMAQQQSDFFICTQWAENTLYDQLQKGPIQINHVWRFLVDILDALIILQRKNILYLAWTASNTLIAKDPTTGFPRLQLGDFSHAVLIDSDTDEETLDDIAYSLPPTIVPPEFYCFPEEKITIESLKKADIWGLGCLIFHMVQGHPVHHNLRHKKYEDIREELHENPVPDLRGVTDVSMRDFLQLCFNVDPGERPSASRCLEISNL